jgi:hypothetical protein
MAKAEGKEYEAKRHSLEKLLICGIHDLFAFLFFYHWIPFYTEKIGTELNILIASQNNNVYNIVNPWGTR